MQSSNELLEKSSCNQTLSGYFQIFLWKSNHVTCELYLCAHNETLFSCANSRDQMFTWYRVIDETSWQFLLRQMK